MDTKNTINELLSYIKSDAFDAIRTLNESNVTCPPPNNLPSAFTLLDNIMEAANLIQTKMKLEQDMPYILSTIEACGWDFSTLEYKEEDFIVHWAQDNYYRRCDAGTLSRLIINTNHLQDPLEKHQLKTLETLNNKYNIIEQ